LADIAKLGFEVDTGQLRKAAEALDQLQRSGRKFSDGNRAVETSLSRLERQMRTVTGTIGTLRQAFIAYGAVRIGQGITNTAIAFQKMETTLRFATGSVEGATAEIQFLRRESERLGQDFLTAGRAYSKLAASASALGLSTAEIRNVFTGVSSAATVMGLSAYEAEGAFLALQQMLAKGSVQAEELRGQLGERIPTAFADAAEAMGMTTRQLSKALEQGEVEAKTFVTRLSDLWIQKFGGQIPDATENANIAITDFGNALAELQIAVARSGFLEGLTMGLAKVSALLTDPAMMDGARRFGEILGDAFAFAAAKAETLLRVFAAIAGALKGAALGGQFGGPKGALLGALIGGAAGSLSPEILEQLVGSGEEAARSVADIAAEIADLEADLATASEVLKLYGNAAFGASLKMAMLTEQIETARLALRKAQAVSGPDAGALVDRAFGGAGEGVAKAATAAIVEFSKAQDGALEKLKQQVAMLGLRAEAEEKANALIETGSAALEDAIKIANGEIKVLTDRQKSVLALVDAQQKHRRETEDYNEALEREMELQLENDRGLEKAERRYQDIAQAKSRLIQDIDKEIAQNEALAGATLDGERATRLLRKEQELLGRELGLTAEQARDMAERLIDSEDALDRVRRSAGALEDFFDQAFDRIGSAITEAFTKGEISAVSFRNVAKAVFSEVVQFAVQLSLVNPLKNALTGGQGGLLPTLSSVFGSAASGGGSGGSGGSGGIGSIFSPITNAISNGFTSVTTGIGSFLFGTAPGAAAAAGVAPVVGGLANAGSAGLFGTFGAGASTFASLAGPIAAIAAIAIPLLTGIFGRKPSVGKTSVGRITDLEDPGSTVYSFDNGGSDTSVLEKVIRAVTDAIKVGTERFAGTLRPGSGFDFGYFPSPESGNSQPGGINVKPIIDNILADKDRFKGLSEQEAVDKATLIALKEMVDYQSATLDEIAKNSDADTAQKIIEDLEFGRTFDMLSAALTDLGGIVDANTLAAAQLEVAITKQAEQFATDNATPIVDSLRKAIELFPGMITETITRTVTDASAAASDLAGTVDGLRPGESRFVDPFGNEFAGTLPFGLDADRDADGRVILPGTVEGLGPDGRPVFPSSRDDQDIYIRALEDAATVTEEVARQSANYAANLERVGLAVDMAKAGMDLLVDQITGDFEPAVRGPFQQALEQGQANLDALRTHFEDVNAQIEAANDAFPELNESLIDVTQTIADAQAALIANMQDDFRRSVEDALDPAGAASRAFVDAGRMQLTDAVALGLGGDQALMRDIFRVFGQGLARSGLGFGAMTDALEDLEAAAAEAGITVTGLADAALSAADEPLAIFAAGLTASIAAIDAQTSAIESQVSQWQSLGDALSRGRVARSLNPEISVLDPQARMQAALADYEQIRAAALGGDQTAIGRFDSAGDAALKAFVDYFGQTNQNTVDLFNRIQGDSRAIEDMAVTQIDLLQSQLAELQAIRASLDAAGGSGGQDFGRNPVRNRILANLTGYTGDFGAGGFGQYLANQNFPPALRDLISQIGSTINFADGGLVTGGIPGRDSVSARLMPGERVFSVPHSQMLEQLAANQGGGSREDTAEVIDALRDIAGLLRAQISVSGAGAEGTVKGLAKVEQKLDGVEKRLRGAAA
jgi:tape measure domain-containing protein